jgi:malate/lactate dehydrogenase
MLQDIVDNGKANYVLKDNGKIFVGTGKALSDYAKRTCKTIVVGNPANTNCLIL